jgi:zinc transporter ZupT
MRKFDLSPAMKSVLTAILLALLAALVTAAQALATYLADPNAVLSWSMFKDNFGLIFWAGLIGGIVQYVKSHLDLVLIAFGDLLQEVRDAVFVVPEKPDTEQPVPPKFDG